MVPSKWIQAMKHRFCLQGFTAYCITLDFYYYIWFFIISSCSIQHSCVCWIGGVLVPLISLEPKNNFWMKNAFFVCVYFLGSKIRKYAQIHDFFGELNNSRSLHKKSYQQNVFIFSKLTFSSQYWFPIRIDLNSLSLVTICSDMFEYFDNVSQTDQ